MYVYYSCHIMVGVVTQIEVVLSKCYKVLYFFMFHSLCLSYIESFKHVYK